MIDWARRVARRIRLLVRRTAVERTMESEIRHHVDLETAELMEQGWEATAARREALRRFGGIEQVKEQARDARGIRGVEDTVVDLRYAARLLRRNPGFTTTAILTFALGVGAASSIFSVVYGVLLRPLPYLRPERLVVLWERDVQRNRPDNVVSLENFEAWQARTASFDGIAAVIPTSATFTDGPEPERVVGAEVTAGYFALLGVTPALGHDFGAAENRDGLAIILSDGYWKRRFGGDPGVVGRVRRIAGRPYTIVGVMPAGFDPPRFSWLGTQDLWFPMPRTAERRSWGRSLLVLARMRDGVTVTQAREEMIAIAAGLERENPANKGWSSSVVPLATQLTGDARTTLLVLLAAVGMLLSMSVANVATLTLSSMRRRGQELAVRRAIGATDRRLFRQLFVQSALLAAVGTLAGLLAAPAGVALLLSILPPDMPRVAAIRVDMPVLAITSLVAAIATMIFGAAAAVKGRAEARVSPLAQAGGELRASARSGGGGLVAVEIALALALSVMAVLMGRTLVGLRAVDLGFNPDGVAVARISLPDDRYRSPASQRAFFDDVLERTRSIPGVVSAGIISARPLSGMGPATTVADPLAAAAPGTPSLVADVRVTDAAVFEALRVPLVAGRLFDRSAESSKAPQLVISRDLAEALWPLGDAVGRKLSVQMYDGLTGDVIGVVGPVHLMDPRTPIRPSVYLPASRFTSTQRDLVIRVAGSPEAIVPAVRSAVGAIDKTLPVFLVATMTGLVNETLAADRFTAFMLAAFAGIALLLAGVGIFGVFSAEVIRRRKEIGIRMALGARGSQVVARLVGLALRRAAVGVVAGLVFARLLSGSMEALLYGVRPSDSLSLIAVAALMIVVALAATLVPAMRATRRAPLTALREN